MKKLITILGAGLLAFGMFTSCGAKDVNLSWSEEKTSYDYFCDVTAGSITKINEPTIYSSATPVSTYSYDFTFKGAEVKWSEGTSNYQGNASEGNSAEYTIKLSYERVETVTNNTTNLVTSKSEPSLVTDEFTITKVGDKYYIHAGQTNQAEVTIDGDIEDDEFTFSVDDYTLRYVDDWNADGTAKVIQGTNVAVKKAVRINGWSYSGIKVERK